MLSAVFNMDYGSVNTTLLFAACENRSCVNVSITNDNTLENTELFFVNLNRNGLDSRIRLNVTRGEIEILDDDDSIFVTYTCAFSVSHFHQRLWLVWRRHSTRSQREWVLWNSVLLCTVQMGTLNVPLTSPSRLISQLVMAVQVRIMSGEFHSIHVFFLQCLPWTMVLSTLLYHLMHVTYGFV